MSTPLGHTLPGLPQGQSQERVATALPRSPPAQLRHRAASIDTQDRLATSISSILAQVSHANADAPGPVVSSPRMRLRAEYQHGRTRAAQTSPTAAAGPPPAPHSGSGAHAMHAVATSIDVGASDAQPTQTLQPQSAAGHGAAPRENTSPTGGIVLPSMLPAAEGTRVPAADASSLLREARARLVAQQRAIQVQSLAAPTTQPPFDPTIRYGYQPHSYLAPADGVVRTAHEQAAYQADTRERLIELLPSLAADRPQPFSPEQSAIERAASDVAAWLEKLPPGEAVRLSPTQADAYTCPISQRPFAELEQPVGVLSGGVLHVFEAHDLLAWMRISAQSGPLRTASGEGVASHPLTRAALPLGAVQRVDVVADAPV